ncbi:flagellar hook protein FlgE [Methylobacterium sp. NFXW15]|uniref:flagellar hook protein FlgE n=1 Tax=Methylobacterium sp. NFXW15 TaxID=2819512 RepID=UPI003CECF812
MSLTGVLRTGVSGMNAQTNRISTVAENIQNASTTGYKRTSTEFSSLLLESSGTGNYNSGAVDTVIRRAVNEQGSVAFTTSDTDLAIQGSGFFVVKDGSGGQFLTRAGNFVKDGSTGTLVNSGGFTLQGYALDAQGQPDVARGLIPIKADTATAEARPTDTATVSGNLPFDAAVIATPGTADGTYTKKISVKTYDNVGSAVTYDVYATKTSATTWNIALYQPAATAGGAPTKIGEANPTFGTDGQVSAGTKTTITTASGPITLDGTKLTQLAGDFDMKATANGSPPTAGTGVAFGEDGTVFTLYADGSRAATYKVPLASVRSPDQLLPKAGNVFEANGQSGPVELGYAQLGGLGTLKSKALEQSNADVATELTTMIESQSAYTANSKVFMTGSEMLDTLMNLKR